MRLTLNWAVDENQEAFGLYRMKLHNLREDEAGVYLIWYEGIDSDVGSFQLDTGQGIFKDRFQEHREDPEIKECKTDPYRMLYGEVKVTFACVKKRYRNGIESYLADMLDLKGTPGKAYPEATWIEVNLPEFLPQFEQDGETE